jgi:hypothetical protein
MSSGRILAQKLGNKSQLIFVSSPHHHHINLIQHDSSHGLDDQPKTIDHHHLGMSRDDGMDEHGIDLMYGYVIW